MSIVVPLYSRYILFIFIYNIPIISTYPLVVPNIANWKMAHLVRWFTVLYRFKDDDFPVRYVSLPVDQNSYGIVAYS